MEKKNIEVKGGTVVIGGKSCDLSSGEYAYDNMVAMNDDYAVIGVHGSNPGCYKYLEFALVVDRKTGDKEFVRLWQVGDRHNSEDAKLQMVSEKADHFYAKTGYRSMEIFPERVFAADVKSGEVIRPTLVLSKMETCFDYEIMDDMAILMTLKEEVPMTQFLKWHGFNMNYDAFKIWGSFVTCGQSYLMFVNTKAGKTWTVSYGNSTTCTTGEVWQQRDEILKCMIKSVPNHPAFRTLGYLEEMKA